ncbi:KTSC domain-containing protein [Aureliella helgolandensis]|uniref:Uncharacterized protein n=1 Tax=Aureliella helgolandensis TaxID=2527968 RepID=A0A518GCM1_9BACT|nr:KTSC domain-containing protein [Aureliella helgolandensis]QDV26344.1 hypothetical protein Q31a_47170 [Aureliella helgolandensis]
MSILSRLANRASRYIKARVQSTLGARSRARPPGNMRTSSGKPPIRPYGSSPGAPPVVGGPGVDGHSGATGLSGVLAAERRRNDENGDDDDFDDIQLLGRDAGYDQEEFQRLEPKMRRVSSSNVFSYAFEMETARQGILYVTFLDYTPKDAGGDGSKKNSPGSTYAYYDFPLAKFKQFEAMAASTAGGAVWDYCRVRHSGFEHQHSYRLVQSAGDYIPRKATAGGWKARSVPTLGIGKRSARRSTLKPRTMHFRAQANNGAPNRGAPNRGNPNRGS